MIPAPITFDAGAFSALPDTPWLPACVANTGRHELQAISQPISVPAQPTRLALQGDAPCQLAASLIPAAAIETCTWTALRRARPIHLGHVNLSAGVPAVLEPRLPVGHWRVCLKCNDIRHGTVALAAIRLT